MPNWMTTGSKQRRAKEAQYLSYSNALSYDSSDDSILVSLRHQNWIIKVDRKTGAVIWRLGAGGDFTLEIGSWFYSQHDPKLDSDGTILIFDNGNDRPGDALFSRVVRYRLNMEEMRATEIWSYGTDLYNSFLGGVEELDTGNVLICAGGNRVESETGPSGLGTAQVIEITGDDEALPVWELTAPGKAIYRANRISHYWSYPNQESPQ